MKVTFLGQGLASSYEAPLFKEIEASFSSKQFDTVEIWVAFTSVAGAKFLRELAEKYQNYSVTIYVGVDLQGTSKEALELLLTHRIQAFVFHTVSTQIYHPKVYFFHGDDSGCLYVGSSNLTNGGLGSNVEASLQVNFDLKSGVSLVDQVNNFFGAVKLPAANTKALNQNLIDLLVADGTVPTEAARAAAHKKSNAIKPVGNTKALFPPLTPPTKSIGYGAGKKSSTAISSVSTPAAATAATKPSAATSNTGKATKRRFWIEARTLTGGSRNQLDLSMAGANNQIAGSLALFGVNGLKTTIITKLALRYKGNDYFGNEIRYPITSAGKSNKTWRMQMHGLTLANQSLTTCCATDFMGKTLLFKEIGSMHYQISAVSTSKQLKRLQKLSKKWDRNKGGNGRYFGELS